jgi:hypothetical protein
MGVPTQGHTQTCNVANKMRYVLEVKNHEGTSLGFQSENVKYQFWFGHYAALSIDPIKKHIWNSKSMADRCARALRRENPTLKFIVTPIPYVNRLFPRQILR